MRISTVKKILLGLTAFSLFVTPAQASEITDRDGNSLIDPTANVHNLYAQQLDGTTARSTYDKFSLDENQIANMHFNQQGGTTFATDLINVVNHRIDINGTVNAIRNGAVDGNLFFLSPEGIAVGKSGVINAGSFNAQSDGGSIDIKGAINARNNITLQAQNITVDGAELNANTNINFSTLVNAGSTVNNINNLRMTADPSGNGDIIIRAESTTTLDTSNDNNSNISLQAIVVNSDVSALDSAYARKLINDGNYTTTASTGGATACIADSNITAGGNITINSVEHIDANLVNGSQSNVGATVIAVNHNSKVAIDHSNISGKSVDIRAQQSGSISSTVNHAGAGVAEFGIGFNSVKRSGDTTVSLRGSNITASNGNINIRAEDNLGVTLNNTAPLTPAVGVNSSVAKYNNGSNTRVIVESLAGIADILNASGDINVNVSGANAVNINGTTTVNNAVDNANVGITVKDGSHSFKGNNISVSSGYSPAINASTINLGGGNNVNVGGDNSFDASNVNFGANSGGNLDADSLATNSTTSVKVGSQTYQHSPNITVDSSSDITQHALQVVSASDIVSASIGSGSSQQSVASLNVNADNSVTVNSNALENNSNIAVSANVGGSWIVEDNLAVSATSNDNFTVANTIDDASVNLGGNTNAALDSAAIINAKSVNLSARSNFNADNSLDFNANLNVNKKSAVDVGATVTTTGAQAYSAASNGNLVNKVRAIDTVSDGNAYVDANSNVAVDNRVRIAKDAALKADDAVSIRANDVLNLESSAVGVNYSSAGAIITRTSNSIDRKNIVDVAGNIRADGIITVEAGAIADANPQIVINANTDSSNPLRNLSQLPADLQVSTYTLSENNSVSVDGTVHGSNDVNLRASEGNVNVRHSNRMRGFLTDAYYDNLLEIGDGNKINAITVNGRAQAGVSSDDININISGTVVPSNYNIAGSDNSGTLTVNSNVDVDYSEGDMQYAKELTDRLNTLDDLIRQYTTGAQTDVSNAALAGYVAERERVMQKLRALGLVEQEGNNESVKDEGIDVRYVELGNLFANGGTLTLNADTVSGSGTLKAVGSANVNITNTSNAYLILNDIIRDSTGGYITLNGKTVSSYDDALAASLTVDSSAETGAGAITVLNNPNTSIVNVTATLDGSPSTYTPRSDLRLKGSIENFYGDISIVNRKGDIDIASEYVKDANGLLVVANTAEVIGKNVLIEANGTFSQGYVDGMLNISKSLETIFQDQTQNLPADARSHLNVDVDITDISNRTDEYVTTVASNVAGGTTDGRISGSNIWISALDLNINGIIQSGFDSYIINVKPEDVVDGNYVGKSGAVYNADKGFYDYYVPVTYADGKLRAEDIETGGGQIYLSGQIASTGNGKIFAANGLANISVNNNSSIPIELGKIINNNRSGKITIVDTGNDTWQEFTPGQTRFINNYTMMLERHYLDGMLYDTMQTTSNNLDSQNMYYQPAAGLRYNWTSGNEERTTNFYLDGKRYDQIINVAEIDPGASLSLNNSDDRADNTLYLTAESQLIRINYFMDKRNADFHTEYITLQTYTFNINAAHPIELGFIGQEKGPVSIASNADLSLAGNITLGDQLSLLSIQSDGNIRQAEGTLLATNNALIHAGGDIGGINIESLGHISNDGSYTDQVNLEAISDGGNININVQGGMLNGQRLPGNVFFAPIISLSDDGTRGNVTLTATGDINGIMASFGKNASTVTPDIVANNVKLTSLDCSVGKYGTPLKIDANGAVDVNANNDVALASAFNKSLTIGQIKSANGDVFLNSWGDNAQITQSADYQPDVDDVDSTTLIHDWIDAGLIAPTEDYEGTYVGGLIAAVEKYAQSISGEYQSYAQNRDAYNQLKTTVANEFQQYLAVKDSYNDEIEQTSVLFTRYQTDAGLIRTALGNEYADMKNLESKTRKTSSEKTRLKNLQAKFAGFDSADDYFIVHAKELLNNDAYNDFIGYDDVFDYMASTTNGLLIAKYSSFDSPDAYLKTTSGYALEQKYGAYPSIDDFLNADATYRQLVSKRDNVTFPNTLEEMLDQVARQREADSLNITSKHLYVDNRRLR